MAASLVRNQERLAFCSAERLEVAVDVRHSQSSVNGRIGSIALQDLTPAGALYPSVFSTVGDDMLRFEWSTLSPHSEDAQLPLADDVSRRTAEMPDVPTVSCASRLRLHMGSIRYVHTRRFVTLLSNFMTQLQNMQEVMAQMRSMAEGIAAELRRVTYTSLLRLDVKIDSPVVVVPRNSLSTSVLEADLGRTTMTNSLRLLPPGTNLAHGITGDLAPMEHIFGVVQCMEIQVRDMRLCSAQHVLPRLRSRPTSASRSTNKPDPLATLVNLNEVEMRSRGQRPSRRYRRAPRVPLHATNLDDSEDTQPSGEEALSDSGSESVSSTRAWTAETQEVARFELLSESSITINFARNLSLERHDIANADLDVRVSNVEVQVSCTRDQTPCFYLSFFFSGVSLTFSFSFLFLSHYLSGYADAI